MIELNIPGRGRIQLEHLVANVNGTLAVDGQLLDGMSRSLKSLRDRLTIHLLTPIRTTAGPDRPAVEPGCVRSSRGWSEQKADYVRQLGSDGGGDRAWRK
jgi:hypothetical protein